MAEFVEHSLESLLPVFEQLSHVQLFTDDEVNSLVKRCRRLEYRLQKREKQSGDFIQYGDYLLDVYTLVRSRRSRINYWHKVKLIDLVILRKIASIYRRCCDRFQGRIELWKRMFAFLEKYHLRRELSKAYTRCLQIHGRNIDLRCESALWEFFSNSSADNARTQLMLAQRVFPKEPKLFQALFKIEIHYVSKVMQRRQFLKTVHDKSKKSSVHDIDMEGPDDSIFDIDVDDSVLQLKVAEVVIVVALKTVRDEDKGALLLTMWRDLQSCTHLPEESAGRLRDVLEVKLNELQNEFSQLLIVEQELANGTDIFAAYDSALERCTSEAMIREYIKFCQSRDDDPFAELKISTLFKLLVDKEWAKEGDFKKIALSVENTLAGEDTIRTLEKAIKACPGSANLWYELIRHRMDSEKFDTKVAVDEFVTFINSAFDKVSGEDAYPLWELAIDFAILHTPNKVEQVFTRASIMACPNVSSQVKVLRLEYLEALVNEGAITLEDKRGHVRSMMTTKPNMPIFYLAVVEEEAKQRIPDVSICRLALDLAVNEHSKTSIESWIAYAKYAMVHDPLAVGKLYQRAILSLEPSICSEFITAWTRLQQAEAAAVADKDLSDKESRSDIVMKRKKVNCDLTADDKKGMEPILKKGKFGLNRRSKLEHPKKTATAVVMTTVEDQSGDGSVVQTVNSSTAHSDNDISESISDVEKKCSLRSTSGRKHTSPSKNTTSPNKAASTITEMAANHQDIIATSTITKSAKSSSTKKALDEGLKSPARTRRQLALLTEQQ